LLRITLGTGQGDDAVADPARHHNPTGTSLTLQLVLTPGLR
jgi:hypothetical protein